MPQRRNDRGELKTKEITNDDAERTGKGWFHSQRRRANDTDGNCNRRNSAICLALRVLRRGAPCTTAPSQILAPGIAWIIHFVRNLLRALGRKFIEPINELGVAATLLNQTVQPITTIAPTLVAAHAQHIELADEIAECDCAVAGHPRRCDRQPQLLSHAALLRRRRFCPIPFGALNVRSRG